MTKDKQKQSSGMSAAAAAASLLLLLTIDNALTRMVGVLLVNSFTPTTTSSIPHWKEKKSLQSLLQHRKIERRVILHNDYKIDSGDNSIVGDDQHDGGNLCFQFDSDSAGVSEKERSNNINNKYNKHCSNDKNKQQRLEPLEKSSFSWNIMGIVLMSQLFVTKALAVGLAGVMTASIVTTTTSLGDTVLIPLDGGRGRSEAEMTSTILINNVETSLQSSSSRSRSRSTAGGVMATKFSIKSSAENNSNNNMMMGSHVLLADDNTATVTVMPTLDKVKEEVVVPMGSETELQMVGDTAVAATTVTKKEEVVVSAEDEAMSAEEKHLELDEKLAESKTDDAKKIKAKDVVAPPIAIPTTSTATASAIKTGGKQDRDKLIFEEEEARIESEKRVQLEKIQKEQQKARLSAEKDAEKARLELEQRAEKAARKARADAEKKAREAKIKAVRDLETSAAEQAKIKYQEAEKARTARIRAEDARRKLERESLDLNTSLEFLRKTEEAKKAEAKAADDVRIKATEERVRVDQELKKIQSKEFEATVEDIALLAVPSALIAGAVYTSGALKRESEFESNNLMGKEDPSLSTPYGLRDNGGGGGGPVAPFFGMGSSNQGRESPSPPFEMDNQGGGFSQPSFPSEPPTSTKLGDMSSFMTNSQPKSAFPYMSKSPSSSSVSGPKTSALKGSMAGQQSNGMPKQIVTKTKAFGNVYPAPAFPAFQTPLRGRESTGGGDVKGFGSTTFTPGPKSFGKFSPKGSTLVAPPKQSFSPIPSPFEKAPQKGFVSRQEDIGNMVGPGFKSESVSPKQVSPTASKSFGMSPPKGALDAYAASSFGGGRIPSSSFGNAPLKGAAGGGSTFTPGMPLKTDSGESPKSFAKASFKKASNSKSPYGGGVPGAGGPVVGTPPKAESVLSSQSSFGKAPFKGSDERMIPLAFGGGGSPSKAADASFGNKALAKDPGLMKGPFGKSLSADTMGAKKTSTSSFGGGSSPFGKATSQSPFGGGMPSKAVSSSFGKSPLKGSADSTSPFGGDGGGMPSVKAGPTPGSFGKAPLKGAAGGGSTFTPGMPLKTDSGESPKSFAKASFNKASNSKSPYGGGVPGAGGPVVGTPPKAESVLSSQSSFGKAPFKGSDERMSTSSFGGSSPFGKATSQSPFGGGMPSKAVSSSFGKSPLKGSADSTSPFGGDGGGMPSVKAGPTPGSFGKASLKGAAGGGSTFTPGMPLKTDSGESPKSFAKASFNKASNSKSPYGGGVPGAGGPVVGTPPKAESVLSSQSSFGKAPFKGSDERMIPLAFGGGGSPSKAADASFGNKALAKDPGLMKGPFGKSLSADTMGAKKTSTSSFGGGSSPFGKATSQSPFGGGMPSKAASSSFGKSPLKGSADSTSPFGGDGGGMPSVKAGPTPGSFGKASLKGAAGGGSTFTPGTGMSSNAESFGYTPPYAPLFPNKGGIIAESDSLFVAKDILLDAELGRGAPEIASDEPSTLPLRPKAASTQRPVFGLGGAFGKSAPRQPDFGSPKSASLMHPKGSMLKGQQADGFFSGLKSASPPNASTPAIKRQLQQPPQPGRPSFGAPSFDSGMDQIPPKSSRGAPSLGSNVNPFAGDVSRQRRTMRQPTADNISPDTNQFASRQSVRRQQQPQPTANVPRRNISQPPPQSAYGFQQGPSNWKNQAVSSPIGQISSSVRDTQRARGTLLGSLASGGQQQSLSPAGSKRPNATGPIDSGQFYSGGPIDNDQFYSGGSGGPGDYQYREVTVTDPRTGDRRTIRVPPPNLGGNN